LAQDQSNAITRKTGRMSGRRPREATLRLSLLRYASSTTTLSSKSPRIIKLYPREPRQRHANGITARQEQARPLPLRENSLRLTRSFKINGGMDIWVNLK
jgi:hypothetical protein